MYTTILPILYIGNSTTLTKLKLDENDGKNNYTNL